MREECRQSTWEMRKAYNILVVNSEWENTEVPDADGRILLGQDPINSVGMGNGFIWHRMGTDGVLL